MSAPAVTGPNTVVAANVQDNLSISAPAHRKVGDGLLVTLWLEANDRQPTTPAGWTLLGEARSATAPVSQFWWGRMADGTSADDFATSWSGACYRAAEARRIVGAAEVGDWVLGAASEANSQAWLAKGVTVPADDSLGLLGLNTRAFSTLASAPPGWSPQSGPWFPFGGGWTPFLEAVLAAGATGDLEGEFSKAEDWVSALLVIPPIPPAPPVDPTALRPVRKPPLELDAEVETAEGAMIRLPADADQAKNRPTNLASSTLRGSGMGTGSLVLAREIFRDYPDIGLGDTWRFVSREGAIPYEGRLQSSPRVNDPHEQIMVKLVGWATYLNRKIAPLIIDHRTTSWGEATNRRKAAVYETGNYLYNGRVSADWEAETSGPAVSVQWDRLVSAYFDLAEPLFYAGGEDIGELRFSLDVVSGIGADWIHSALLMLDDLWSEFDAAAYTESVSDQSLEASGERKYAGFQNTYAGAFAGDINALLRWLEPRVIGAHGLTSHGPWPEEGFYLSDVIEYVVRTYFPKLKWAGQTNTYPVRQATWHDRPTSGFEVIQELNNLARWETNVWENREFHFEPADLTKYDWVIDVSDPGVSVDFQGDSIERVANGIVVSHTDFSGVRRVLWPEDHPELRDESEDNPANRHGEPLYMDADVPWQCGTAEALRYGAAKLAESNRPKRPGTFRVAGGYIRNAAGHWRPGWEPRNGETLGVLNHVSDAPRLLTATSWDQRSLTASLTVDLPKMTLDAIDARHQTALVARGLA